MKEGEQSLHFGGNWKQSYLNGRHSYVLYFWTLTEYYDFTGACIQRIDSSLALDGEHVPDASESRRGTSASGEKRKRDIKEKEDRERETLEELMGTNRNTNYAMYQNNLSNMNADLTEWKGKLWDMEDDIADLKMGGAQADRLKRKEERYADLKRTIDGQEARIEEYTKVGMTAGQTRDGSGGK